MVYFQNVKTIQELKKQYKELVMKYHPDLNKKDTTQIMQEINSQYDELFKKVKNSFTNTDGKIYEKDNQEDIEDFKHIINKIITFKECKIEIIGNWIWVSGNTKFYKKTKRIYTLEELRKSFITVNVDTKDTQLLE